MSWFRRKTPKEKVQALIDSGKLSPNQILALGGVQTERPSEDADRVRELEEKATVFPKRTLATIMRHVMADPYGRGWKQMMLSQDYQAVEADLKLPLGELMMGAPVTSIDLELAHRRTVHIETKETK